MYRRIGIALVALVGLVAACGDDGAPEKPPVISPEKGGTVAVEAVTLSFPPGAVSTETTITVEPAPNPPADPTLIPGTTYEFGPDGIVFEQPVTLTLDYDPSKLPAGVAEADLAIHKAFGSEWRRIEGTTVHPDRNQVTAQISGFSSYGILGRGQPADVAVSAGDAQTAAAGTATPVAPAVLVTDADGAPLAGVSVRFEVTAGGGSIANAAATTNSAGIATGGAWTLGTTAGANTLVAQVGGALSVTFTATGTAGAAAALEKTAGDQQTGSAGAALETAPAVRVTDAHGNAVEGATVAFVVTAGGGSVATDTATSDAQGLASAGTWTLGREAGAQTLAAMLVGTTVAAEFSATAGAGAAAAVEATAGAAQHGRPGAALPVEPVVRVRDAFGNLVEGAEVAFAASGGGSVASATATTGADGTASAGAWTLGTGVGEQTLTASVAGGASVTLSATALDCAAGSLGAVAVGDTVAGALTLASCLDASERAIDYYTLTLDKPAVFELTASAGGFVPRIGAYEGEEPRVAQLSAEPGFTRAALGAGTYRLYVGAATVGTLGVYSFSLEAAAGDGAACDTHDVTFVGSGARVAQAITAEDCADEFGPPGRSYDSYYLATVPGRSYRLTLEAAGAAGLSLWGPEDGEWELEEHRQTPGAGIVTLTFTASEAAYYGINPLAAPGVSYSLAVDEVSVTDPCVAQDAAPVGSWTRGEFDAYDCDAGAGPEDYYRLEIDQQRSFSVELLNDQLTDPRIGITPGTRRYHVYSADDSPRFGRVVLAPGSYWLGVLANQTTAITDYELAVFEADHDLDGCGGAFDVFVTPGVATSGALTANDCEDQYGVPGDRWDGYSLYLEAGKTYQVTLTGTPAAKMSLWGPLAGGGYGFLEHRQSADGGAVTLTHTAQVTGGYDVYPLGPVGTTYDIAFAEIQTPADACAPQDAFEPNTFLHGTITAGDCDAGAYAEDYYRVEITQQTQLVYDMFTTAFAPQIGMAGTDRHWIGGGSSPDSIHSVMRMILAPGTYWVSASVQDQAALGPYDIVQNVEQAVPEGCWQDRSELNVFVTDGVSATGQTLATDCFDAYGASQGAPDRYHDSYGIRVSAGQTLTVSFTLTGGTGGVSIWGYNPDLGDFELKSYQPAVDGAGAVTYKADLAGFLYINPVADAGTTYQLDFDVTGTAGAGVVAGSPAGALRLRR